jgi:chemotaxis protein CheX
MIEREEMARWVREATAEVFTTMLGMEITSGPARADADAPTISDGVLSVVGLAGPWTGAGCVACSAGFARRICAALLMTEADSVNEDVLDAVGEVTNMIIGNFKTMAEERLGAMALSIPTVIYGRNFTSRSIGQTDWIVLPFECEDEKMEIRVCLAPSKNTPSLRAGYSHPSAIMG